MGNKRVGVMIGRFEGYHKGHHEHLVRASKENDQVIVLIGSSNSRISIKNPFSAVHRGILIYQNLINDPEVEQECTFKFSYLPDHPLDDDAWAENVRQLVNPYVDGGCVVTLYGCDKDSSTFYLNMFPEWKQSFTDKGDDFDATKLRAAWFESHQSGWGLGKFVTSGHISKVTHDWLSSQPFNANLQDEWDFYQKEKKLFGDYPFPETLTFCCADAVIQWKDEFLFIIRARNPGKGCLALPGGFKNSNENFFDAAVRELYEETRLNIPPDVLMKCFQGMNLYDDPRRSLGIPRCTLAVHFDVTEMFEERPIAYPADDAAGYKWVKKNQLDDVASIAYDDHIHIVKQLAI